MPHATNGSAAPVEGSVVTLEGAQLLVDGASAGSTEDALVATLAKTLRTRRTSPPKGPPVLLLRLPQTTPASSVKRIVEGAAAAGYPRVAIAVRAAYAEAHLDVDADPSAWPQTAEPEPRLHVSLQRDGQALLTWRRHALVVSALDVRWNTPLDQTAFADTIGRECTAGGTHHDPLDRAVDHATVSTTEGVDLAALVATLDAIAATRRSLAGTLGPAFAVALAEPPVAVVPEPEHAPGKGPPGPWVHVGDMVVSGRLPPEIVKRMVRQSYGRFRYCYDAGLRRNGKLAGEIVVRFTIRTDGSVGKVAEESTTLSDAAARRCVLNAVKPLVFPAPEAGTVDVMFPLELAPGPAAR